MSNENRDFFLKAAVGIVFIAGAMYFQATAGDVPTWILTGVSGFVGFVLGLTTRPPQ